MPDSKLVGTAKPKITGGVLSGAAGSTLPVDAVAAVAEPIIAVGYIGEDGVSQNTDRNVEKFKAWGGTIVHTAQTEYGETFSFTFLESSNADVLKAVYGESNVTVTGTGAEMTIAVKHTDTDVPPRVFVFDMVSGGRPRRIAAPLGKLNLAGEVKYAGNDLISYQVEVDALPDVNNVTSYEYIGSPAA